MAKKSNDNPNHTKPPSEHDNHKAKGDDHSLTSSASSSTTATTNEGSFKNYGTGPQNFRDTDINSDSCSCAQNRTRSNNDEVYLGSRGPQDFEGANINGVKVESESSPNNFSGSQTTSGGELHFTGSGTRGSFNNYGSGSQSFQRANINSGAKQADL